MILKKVYYKMNSKRMNALLETVESCVQRKKKKKYKIMNKNDK